MLGRRGGWGELMYYAAAISSGSDNKRQTEWNQITQKTTERWKIGEGTKGTTKPSLREYAKNKNLETLHMCAISSTEVIKFSFIDFGVTYKHV